MSDQQPASSAMAAELVAAQAKILELEQTVNDLRARNDELQADLNAFDHSFFDELEDLKFNYNEARRKNEELEKRLRGDDGDVNE